MDRLFVKGNFGTLLGLLLSRQVFFPGHMENDFMCLSQTSLNCCCSCLMRWPVWNPSRSSISPRSVHILNFSATVDICFAAIMSFRIHSINDEL